MAANSLYVILMCISYDMLSEDARVCSSHAYEENMVWKAVLKYRFVLQPWAFALGDLTIFLPTNSVAILMQYITLL
jgi:hypothetical protein